VQLQCVVYNCHASQVRFQSSHFWGTMVALRVSSLLPCAAPQAPRRPARRSPQGGRQRAGPVAAHTVTVEHKGQTHKLSIEGDATILEAALDAGIELPHDCKARAVLCICDMLRVYALSPQARCCDVMLLCVQSCSALRKALPWSGRCWAATEVWRPSGLTPDALPSGANRWASA
jgi:hypothetical protein